MCVERMRLMRIRKSVLMTCIRKRLSILDVEKTNLSEAKPTRVRKRRKQRCAAAAGALGVQNIDVSKMKIHLKHSKNKQEKREVCGF